jgi:hypothetical protein
VTQKIKRIIAGALLAFSAFSQAQNVIIENEYVRAGVNLSTGTLGSGGATRPGLQYDNTGTHTWPCSSCQGDYLTPGSPFEGFTVRIEDSSGTLIRSYTNNNTGSRSITTGVWSGSPTAASAIWAASTVDFDITHTYSLPSGQKYIDINTQFTALAAMPKLYFGRYIDPDAMPMTGDTSATDNVLGYGAIPAKNVVFSEATVSRYALGLYTSQTTGSYGAGISSSWSTNPTDYLNNTGGLTVVRGDYTIGLGFMVSGVSIGDIVNFQYAYIFGPNAFSAADSAVTGGAGGGTSGTVPGGGTLVDVGSATSSGGSSSSSTPTVTGTSTATITVSDTTAASTTLPVIIGSLAHHTASESDTTQTIARETTTTVTTPMERTLVTKVRTTTTWSDGTTTTSDSATTTATTVSNSVATSVANASFSGRIDQANQLSGINKDLLSGIAVNPFRGDMIATENGHFFIGGGQVTSEMKKGYGASSDTFKLGGDMNIDSNWRLGLSYNKIDTTLTGSDSKTKQNKESAGLYSIYKTDNDIVMVNNFNYGQNNISNSRTIEGLFNNSYTTTGSDLWINHRIYAPEIENAIRPFAGYSVMHSETNGYTESGSVQSARTVGSTSSDTGYAEAGVRVSKRINDFAVTGEFAMNSDTRLTAEAGVTYSPYKDTSIGLYGTSQQGTENKTDTWALRGVMRF